MSYLTGALTVTLREASFLRDASLVGQIDFLNLGVGKQDPYAVLSVRGDSQRSKTLPDAGKQAKWDEVFVFENVRPHADGLIVEFYDENMLLQDVSLGFVRVPMGQLPVKKHMRLELPILCKKKVKPRGTCVLELGFVEDATVASPKGPPPKSCNRRWVLPGARPSDPWVAYEQGSVLGQGGFGKTYQATCRQTGEQVAVKSINKLRLSHTDIARIQREVQIMHHLAGHPNIVELKDTYEDEVHVYLVLELCTGGELFEAIWMRGRYTEKDAAALMRTAIKAVAYCHSLGVIHHDIKPPNFLLASDAPDAPVKLTDFGLSHFFKDNMMYTDTAGTLSFTAPEVMKRRYNKEADIWSLGVLLYNMLSGYRPFAGRSDEETCRAVQAGEFDLKAHPWPKISDPAKDCIRRMLQVDPSKRATAQEVLCHEWMRERGCAGDAPIELEVVRRLRAYSAMHRLKKEVLKLIARSLPSVETEGMRELFLDMDADGSGTISAAELREALARKSGGRGSLGLSNEELDALMKSADTNGDGVIDYGEFLASMVHRSKMQREDLLRKAFAKLDADGSGAISRAEVVRALSHVLEAVQEEEVDAIMRTVDVNGDGGVDFREFCDWMRAA